MDSEEDAFFCTRGCSVAGLADVVIDLAALKKWRLAVCPNNWRVTALEHRRQVYMGCMIAMPPPLALAVVGMELDQMKLLVCRVTELRFGLRQGCELAEL